MSGDVLGYYRILDCSEDVDEKTLKIKYRDNAKMWHPDHNKSPNALEVFQKISLAYNILSNKHSRLVYDLLCLVYSTADFPDMKALKIYKSSTGEETPFLRVFKLIKISRNKEDEQNLVGTFADAEQYVNTITKHNWLKGWWQWGGVRQTVNALKSNYRLINQNRFDNFKMLVHNGAAFYAENKDEKAYISLLQAFEYATDAQQVQLQNLMSQLSPVRVELPEWDYSYLRQIQLFIPKILFGIFLLCLLVVVWAYWPRTVRVDDRKINYYQEVRFNNGSETVDDVVVAKVFNIPVDPTDVSMLYYTTDQVSVMYGPSEEFDVMDTARMRQTVRVTGYTPDRQWYRVMLDNGEMGFVKKEYLKKGIGREIPSRSKVFYNPEE